MRLTRLALAIAFAAFLAAGLVGIVAQAFVTPIVSVPPAVDTGQLEEHVRYLSQNLYPRSYDQFKNIELAAA
jgi:hypothetical protein